MSLWIYKPLTFSSTDWNWCNGMWVVVFGDTRQSAFLFYPFSLPSSSHYMQTCWFWPSWEYWRSGRSMWREMRDWYSKDTLMYSGSRWWFDLLFKFPWWRHICSYWPGMRACRAEGVGHHRGMLTLLSIDLPRLVSQQSAPGLQFNMPRSERCGTHTPPPAGMLCTVWSDSHNSLPLHKVVCVATYDSPPLPYMHTCVANSSSVTWALPLVP